MTDKEKIRKEVERLRSLHQMKYQQLDTDNSMSLVECGKRNLCNELLSFIDSLQEEPVSKRFAFKAIPRLLEMIEPTDRAKAYTAKLADTLEVEGYSTDAKIVRVSLKIMNGEKVPMATMDEEPVSEELEDEIKKYCADVIPTRSSVITKAIISLCARHFAEWQKEQIMKDATEAIVKVDAGDYPYIPQIELYDYDKDVPLAKEGDKYKIILIKEE